MEDHLTVAPVEFKRMLSWKLSAPIEVVRKTPRKKKNVNHEEPVADVKDDEQTNVEEGVADHVYIYVDSEGEEEAYYSAVESPVTSEDEDNSMRDCPQKKQEYSRKAKKKKKKKKARYISKVSRDEFFKPLCDLIEDKLHIDVGQMEVSSYAQVPSLAEICLQKFIKYSKNSLYTEVVPFLIHSLLSTEKERRNIAATHIQWMERILASYEKQSSILVAKLKKDNVKHSSAFILQPTWAKDMSLNELPNEGELLHCPLPSAGPNSIVLLLLLHFANYFFPLFSNQDIKSSVPSSLVSSSQLVAIRQVNHFIRTRYTSLAKEWSQFLYVWPSYIYWARGQLELSANAFISSLKFLHVNDKACVLNEIGRMCLTFGDRNSACHYFRQAALTAQDEEPQYSTVNRPWIEVSAFALEASVWDCGLLTSSSAREAARAWTLVVKEASKLSSFPWYLHAAACESRLCFHAGEAVGRDPSSPSTAASSNHASNREAYTRQWLKECEELCSELAKDHPVLFYHLSLVHALQGNKVSSRFAWSSFIDRYYGFHDWPLWLPHNTRTNLFHTLPGSTFDASEPWQSLLDMLTAQKLRCAPVMKIHWRLRLLHPFYPYYTNDWSSLMLADHCARSPGLRLTPDGYLTGDFNLDMPPMKCVLIDPYTGLLCFSHCSSLQHYNLHQFCPPVINGKVDEFALPWPLRILESEQCIVELQMMSSVDLESSRKTINHRATLHWYGQDGQRKRLDLRKLIRLKLRESLLKQAEDEKDELLLDKLMKLGRYVHVTDLKKKLKQKYEKGQRNYCVYDFSLELTYHAVYGEGTVMLCFNLDPTHRGKLCGQVLVIVDCTNIEDFSTPKIYCAGSNGFQMIYPSPGLCSMHRNYHLMHLRYAMAVCTEADPVNHTQMVFDRKGNVVHRKMLSRKEKILKEIHLEYLLTLGEKFFNFQINPNGSIEVYSCDVKKENKTSQSLIADSVHLLTSIPGLLLLHTNRGVALLHPGTLETITIRGKELASAESHEDTIPYQFNVEDVHFEIVKVWDVSGCGSGFGSCCAAFTINNRLLVVRTAEGSVDVEVSLDVKLSGKITEICPMDDFGYMVSVTQFPDHFREDMYWLSTSGELLGVLPAVGKGPRGIISAVLKSNCTSLSSLKPTTHTEEEDNGGLYVFFNDGMGAIACLRPFC